MDSTSKALSIPHILIRIFKHLPARDIINSRRVCQLWNKYCDCEPKFVFRRFDLQPHEIDALLRQTDCQRLSLEFQDCDLKCISDEMWKTWSPKLRSLRLHGCSPEIEALKNIISNCVQLEILEIALIRCVHGNLLENMLDYFIERGEQHFRLRKLSINGQCLRKTSQFLKIPTVFPCIVYSGCGVGSGGFDKRWTAGESVGTYDLQKFKTYATASRNDDHWLETPVAPILDHQLFRLIKFETALEYKTIFADTQKRERLFNFFTTRKDLEIIDIRVYEISDDKFGDSMKSLIFHVLKTCSNLREFCLRTQQPQDPRKITQFEFIKLDSGEFKEFFSLISNLQCFKLTYKLILKEGTDETSLLPLSLPSTSSLNVLRLNTKEPYFFSIVKLSTQLRNLNIDVYSDQQLREIIVAMPSLKTLILRLHGCTNYGFTGENEESSIRRLQKLEYLHIIDCEGKITKEVFDEFCLPRLEYLGLKLKSKDNLPETFLNMTALRTLAVFFTIETLTVRNFYFESEVVCKFCKYLGNLKHLIMLDFDDDRDACKEKVLKIFNSVSSLRFITCCRGYNTFIIDRLSGKASYGDNYKLKFCEEIYYKEWDRYYDC